MGVRKSWARRSKGRGEKKKEITSRKKDNKTKKKKKRKEKKKERKTNPRIKTPLATPWGKGRDGGQGCIVREGGFSDHKDMVSGASQAKGRPRRLLFKKKKEYRIPGGDKS